jgi:hypothetical protein
LVQYPRVFDRLQPCWQKHDHAFRRAELCVRDVAACASREGECRAVCVLA